MVVGCCVGAAGQRCQEDAKDGEEEERHAGMLLGDVAVVAPPSLACWNQAQQAALLRWFTV